MRWLAFLVAPGVSLTCHRQLLGLPVTSTAKADIAIAFTALDPQTKALAGW
jgi:hypothetical protein